MQPDRAEIGVATSVGHPKTRSRISNDALVLDQTDGRLTWARRRRDLIRRFTEELDRTPNTRDTVLITNLASAVVRSEQVQCQIARGEPINDEEYVRLGNVITRLIGSLNLRSAPAKPVGPSLQEYLASKSSEGAE
jgi:hypothetical protein